MKTMSAEVAKNKRRVSHEWKTQPLVGSCLRKIYDIFMANKGIPITTKKQFKLEDSSNLSANILKLTDFYGLDIIRLERGKYVLAGEWFGSKYVDYIAERIALQNNCNNS